MEEIFKKYPLLKDQNVPRETLIEFELFISMLKQGNDEINIISKETAKNEVIRERHIIDSAQIIEFVDLNSSIITDIICIYFFLIFFMFNKKESWLVILFFFSKSKSQFIKVSSKIFSPFFPMNTIKFL